MLEAWDAAKWSHSLASCLVGWALKGHLRCLLLTGSFRSSSRCRVLRSVGQSRGALSRALRDLGERSLSVLSKFHSVRPLGTAAWTHPTSTKPATKAVKGRRDEGSKHAGEGTKGAGVGGGGLGLGNWGKKRVPVRESTRSCTRRVERDEADRRRSRTQVLSIRVPLPSAAWES